MIKSPLEYIFDFLESSMCNICGQDGWQLCYGCFQSAVLVDDIRCYMCNKLTKNPGICKSCPSRLRRVWWLGRYKSSLKDLLWHMKYDRRRSVARTFGHYLSDSLPYISEETVVTSVPTAHSRVRVRGFDQAALVARVFARQRSLVYQPLLERTNTVDLIGKSRQHRIKLMADSMQLLRPTSVKDRQILLIDDVLTTGASVEVAATLLRKYGAKHIDAAVVAH